jgi:hypothetical protein
MMVFVQELLRKTSFIDRIEVEGRGGGGKGRSSEAEALGEISLLELISPP